ncbi:MAG: hypothetical protein ONB46_16200 [candidate division KSB1 bacterium]|nr:hypothetical protein [candidate division KSB1 bacterium]MDZ7367301.1 hypothetical protein [candidate division KSB1 bacterium]MDZ7405860.1 hypothetical protein [candidate division KSB1 bacterium]
MKINFGAVFQPQRVGWKTFFLSFAIFTTPLFAAEADSLLAQARLLYYASIKDKTKIEPAIALFIKMGESDARLQGRAQTYIGSLTAVKAKFAFWPHQKWKWTKTGLQVMDGGLALDPDDIESLFIHGTTCYYLPKFFGRSDDAQRHLRQIVRLLPERAHAYDPKLIAHVIDFIVAKIKLSEEERTHLMMINIKLAKK